MLTPFVPAGRLGVVRAEQSNFGRQDKTQESKATVLLFKQEEEMLSQAQPQRGDALQGHRAQIHVICPNSLFLREDLQVAFNTRTSKL